MAESKNTDREALVELMNSPQHAPMSTHSPLDGSCLACPWPLHKVEPDKIIDAILAAGFRRSPVPPSEDAEAAWPELFPGTLEALDQLNIRRDER